MTSQNNDSGQEQEIKSKLQKLRTLAERGSPGEKENARALLEKLCNKYQISPDQIDSADEKKLRWFRHKRGARFQSLLFQCMYKTLGKGRKKFGHGRVSEIAVECTTAEAIEIELDYAFYSEALEDEINRLFDMFIQKNDIFPPNCEESGNCEELTAEDIALYRGIKQRTRILQIAQPAKIKGDSS